MLVLRHYHYLERARLGAEIDLFLYSCPSDFLKRAGERPESKRLTPENAEEKAMDEVFATMLTEKVFSVRPTRLVECGVQYFAEMRLNPQPSVEGYLAHVQAAHPRTKAKLGTVWNRLKDFFSSSDSTTYSDIKEMANVQAFIEAFQTERYIQVDEPTQPEPSTAPAPAISDPSTASASTTRSQVSISNTNSSSSSSNSTLSARAIMRMKIEYDQNFAIFQGEAWKLPSGACVDDIVGQYVRALIKESALHSFVIDLPTIILDLFSDPEDKAALTEALVKREGERTKLVNTTEEAYLRLYDKAPAKIKEMLSQGWQRVCESEDQVPEEVFRESIHLAFHHIYVVYRNNQFKLPEEASESFYLQTLWGVFNTLILCDETLIFRPAEVHSQASSLRKNKDRKAEGTTKQAVGRKVDGLIVSTSTLLELCVLEAARKDAGPNGTKALSDTRKMAKVMKDSFDTICARANTDISSFLVVYGIRIAGASMTFYSMRKRPGRFYQMANDGTVSFPIQWDRSTTITILTIISSVMALRKRISDMAKQVTEWTALSFELLDTSSRSSIPQTLNTPPGSPRLTPRPSPTSIM
ncbi:hypothetical protein BGZ65_011708 [Modicella reniformis]|uniref:Uncharacterized protein n=1 Tax=Modicella reniformis TaxID=1440133 RepID=A0A9P6M1P2_9FUNG|nr:hypothetical protein BGZ65_011708 [Modicella reniformis]